MRVPGYSYLPWYKQSLTLCSFLRCITRAYLEHPALGGIGQQVNNAFSASLLTSHIQYVFLLHLVT